MAPSRTHAHTHTHTHTHRPPQSTSQDARVKKKIELLSAKLARAEANAEEKGRRADTAEAELAKVKERLATREKKARQAPQRAG